MKRKLSGPGALILSAILALAGFAAAFLVKGGPALPAGGGTLHLLSCVLAAALFGFAFTAVRFGLAGGLVMLSALVHDLALTLALSLALARLAPPHQALWIMLLMTVLWTLLNTLARLRALRDAGRASPGAETGTGGDTASAGGREIAGWLAALLFLLAVAIGLGIGPALALLPLWIGLAVSWYSARCVSPAIWAALTGRLRQRRPAR